MVALVAVPSDRAFHSHWRRSSYRLAVAAAALEPVHHSFPYSRFPARPCPPHIELPSCIPRELGTWREPRKREKPGQCRDSDSRFAVPSHPLTVRMLPRNPPFALDVPLTKLCKNPGFPRLLNKRPLRYRKTIEAICPTALGALRGQETGTERCKSAS